MTRAAARRGPDHPGHRQVRRAPGEARRPPHHHRARARGVAGNLRRARRRPWPVASVPRHMNLHWPRSLSELQRIQRERKQVAVERARQSSFLKKRIPQGKAEDIWHRIPLLTKEELRQIPPERFHDEFCIQPRVRTVEYWRSGGATGRPLFYPRSAEDMAWNLLAFQRAFAIIGASAGDCAHISFPLGVHPVAHLY